MKEIKIKKGWYRSAGRKYGWMNMGYEIEGVGINKTALMENERLRIHVAGNVYEVDTEKAVEFIRKWKSFIVMPRGTKIGVISKSIMEYVDSEDIDQE